MKEKGSEVHAVSERTLSVTTGLGNLIAAWIGHVAFLLGYDSFFERAVFGIGHKF